MRVVMWMLGSQVKVLLLLLLLMVVVVEGCCGRMQMSEWRKRGIREPRQMMMSGRSSGGMRTRRQRGVGRRVERRRLAGVVQGGRTTVGLVVVSRVTGVGLVLPGGAVVVVGSGVAAGVRGGRRGEVAVVAAAAVGVRGRLGLVLSGIGR